MDNYTNQYGAALRAARERFGSAPKAAAHATGLPIGSATGMTVAFAGSTPTTDVQVPPRGQPL